MQADVAIPASFSKTDEFPVTASARMDQGWPGDRNHTLKNVAENAARIYDAAWQKLTVHAA